MSSSRFFQRREIWRGHPLATFASPPRQGGLVRAWPTKYIVGMLPAPHTKSTRLKPSLPKATRSYRPRGTGNVSRAQPPVGKTNSQSRQSVVRGFKEIKTNRHSGRMRGVRGEGGVLQSCQKSGPPGPANTNRIDALYDKPQEAGNGSSRQSLGNPELTQTHQPIVSNSPGPLTNESQNDYRSTQLPVRYFSILLTWVTVLTMTP